MTKAFLTSVFHIFFFYVFHKHVNPHFVSQAFKLMNFTTMKQLKGHSSGATIPHVKILHLLSISSLEGIKWKSSDYVFLKKNMGSERSDKA